MFLKLRSSAMALRRSAPAIRRPAGRPGADPQPPPLPQTPDVVGPILFARGADRRVAGIAALLVLPDDRPPPLLIAPTGRAVAPICLYARFGRRAWRYEFSAPADRISTYRLGESYYDVHATFGGDLCIAYVSCNGQEHEDAERTLEERNVMWRRLCRDHDRRPFNLLVHGGDQLYADEVVNAHPGLAVWWASEGRPQMALPFTDAMRDAAERFHLQRYQQLLTHPQLAYLAARVPSIMIWDDHDILDGWGSRPQSVGESPVGRGLFAVARRMFRLFQRAEADDAAADAGTVTTAVAFPRLTVVAPDLRSERTPRRIMGPDAWAAFERGLEHAQPGDMLLIPSSTPVLGPRLSWIEHVLTRVPRLQKYEDDLRDQWQSRAHRAEWRRLLETLERCARDGLHRIALLSGELHLATRGEMPFKDGTILHQLVSSGIAHPPPPAPYAHALSALARIGESPLRGQRIRLMPPPGQTRVYVPERNYLVLERRGGVWSARWELELGGATPAVRL